MPRYTPDPKKATSGFLTYPKGEYDVEIRDPKSFYKPANGTKGENHGVRFAGKIINSDQPSFIGKPYPVQCFMHTDGAQNFTKGIQMAALGCKKDEEFNAKYGDEDLWAYNTDDQSVSDGWHKMSGQVIHVSIGDTKMNNETQDEQTGDTRYSVAR